MQDIMNSSTAAQQSVIQGNQPGTSNNSGNNNNNQLLFTATIFTQDMSQSGNAGGAAQQANETASMMNELNSFISANEMDMSHQAQQAPSNEQMMAPPTEPDVKDSYKGKFSRVHWKAQLP